MGVSEAGGIRWRVGSTGTRLSCSQQVLMACLRCDQLEGPTLTFVVATLVASTAALATAAAAAIASPAVAAFLVG